MRLVDDWSSVLRRAWSLRFIGLAFVFTTLEVALPLLDLDGVPSGVFAAATGLCTGAAFVSRLVAQANLGGRQ